MGTQPMVLIARLDDGRTLYAVEREDRGLYVLCQLGSWVNLRQLKAESVVSRDEIPHKSLQKVVGSDTAPASLITPESSKFSKKKRLAIEAIQSMVRRASTALPVSQSNTPAPGTQPEPIIPAVEDIAVQLSATEMFDNVRTQYLEALYLSKASLAYFAKGPLPRARAAFHLDYDSTLDMNDYVAFLESLVMSTTLIDKKYKDGVPGCVSLIDIHDHSAEDAGQPAKGKKRKSFKKMRPGKTGLYPTEDILIRKWWAGHDDDAESGGPGSSREEVTKSRISQLRIRETQLQMIIILEVLALQPLAMPVEDLGDSLPSALPLSLTGGKEKVSKSKKPDHLTMLIDVHIDRLCIWQSVALEAIETPRDGAPVLGDAGAPNSTKHADSTLRDFCVEIIVPL